MAGRERYIEIVDSVGNPVVILDGDKQGIVDSADGILNGEDMCQWPLLAGSLSTYIWSPRVGTWVLTGATSIISVTGGASAAVQIRVCSGVTAVGDGVEQLSAVLDLQETAPNKKVGVLIETPTRISPGDSAAVEFSGTLTGLVGVLNTYFKRIA